MTLRFNTNISVSTFADAVFNFKDFMVTASPSGPGWTVKYSGDGTGGNYLSGDVINSPSDVNNNTWFVLDSPNSSRELLFHTASTGNLIIRYSKTEGFAGGSASVPATAIDQVSIRDSSVNDDMWPSATLPCIQHMWADDDNEYAFGVFCLGSISISEDPGGFLMDELLSSDSDPVIFYATCLSTWNRFHQEMSFSNDSEAGDGLVLGFQYPTTSYEVWENITGLQLSIGIGGLSDITIPQEMGTDSYNNDGYQEFPILYCNRSTRIAGAPYFKGVGRYVKWAGSDINIMNTFSVNGIDDRVCVSTVSFPWDGSIPVTA